MALEPMGSVGRHLMRSFILQRLSSSSSLLSPPLWKSSQSILNSLHPIQGEEAPPLLPTTTTTTIPTLTTPTTSTITTTLSHDSSPSSFTPSPPHLFPFFLSHPFLKQGLSPAEPRSDHLGLPDSARQSRTEQFGFPNSLLKSRTEQLGFPNSVLESRTEQLGFSNSVLESMMKQLGFSDLTCAEARTEIRTPPRLPLGVVNHSSDLAMEADSVKRKRRKKMNKHKHRKLRRRLRKTKKR